MTKRGWKRNVSSCPTEPQQKGRLRAALLDAIRTTYLLFFFDFPKLVSTLAPILASICLAGSANGPVGWSSRYLLKASAVPGGATILLPSNLAFPSMFTPFQ